MRHFRPRLMAAVAIAVVGSFAASPASADQGANVGTGYVTANVYLSPSVPVVLSACASIAFNFYGSGEGVVFNDNGTQYPGSIPINGTGSDGCAFLERETVGSITVNAFTVFEPPPVNATLQCTALSGSYFRIGTHVHVDVTGSCTINAWASGPVVFISDGEFVPTSGNGVNSPVSSAFYAGAFAIAP
jgi:hypothetical protein